MQLSRLVVSSACVGLVGALVLASSPAHAQKGRGTPPATKGTPTTTTESTSASATTEPKPEPESNERKKNGLLFSLEFGVGRSSLNAFSDSLDFDKAAANGLLYGIGAGVRLNDIRLGLRFRSQSTTEFTLWSALVEAGYGIKLEPLEPIFLLHLGYSWNQELERATISGSLPPGNLLQPEVDLHSFVIGAEVNALYSINQTVKVGPFIGFDFLVVERDQVPFAQSIFPGGTSQAFKDKPLYNEEGHGTGYNLNLGIRGVLDFGF